MPRRTYTTAEAARLIGISKPTLLYWFKVRGVEDVSRDYNGWRVFTEEDIERLKGFRDRGKPRHPAPASAENLGAERRRWLRVKGEFPLRYEFRQNGSDGAIEGISETLDISMGGVMFGVDPLVLPLGEVWLVITFPESDASIATGGEVRWARRWNDSNLLGVQFTGLGQTDRKLIGDYVGRCVAA